MFDRNMMMKLYGPQSYGGQYGGITQYRPTYGMPFEGGMQNPAKGGYSFPQRMMNFGFPGMNYGGLRRPGMMGIRQKY